jgi:hypothetical protein
MNFQLICKAFYRIILVVALNISSPVMGDEKLKIFILAGQSNMVGHADAHTIATLFNSGSERDERLTRLVFKEDSGLSKKVLEQQLSRAKKIDVLTGGISNDKIKNLPEGDEKKALKKHKVDHDAYLAKVTSSCVVSDRVYINSIADGNVKSGKLGVGYGGGKNKLGPEYGFGLSIAEKIKGPILLIKTSWGGKSINYDFRPPSVGEYQLNEKQKADAKADQIRKNASLNYRMMNEAIAKVLANLKDNHPDYNSNIGHEMAGFVWFQGFNDQFSPEFRDNYKNNMIAFIKDIREEYKTPKMPFVVGVLGTGRTAEKVGENKVSLGQREAANAPEFKGNVLSVESYKDYSLFSYEVYERGWAKHFHEWVTVGSDRPYHYLGSGGFFVRLGDSFADAMAQLINH